MNQVQWSVLLMGIVSLLCAPRAWAETNPNQLNRTNILESGNLERTKAGDLLPVATTVDEWITQIAQASIIEIKEARINLTEAGLELTLATTGRLSTPTTSVVGNALIVDIPNARLALPDSDGLQQENPTEEIALVSVTTLPDNIVRIAITGVNVPPTVEVNATDQSLVLGLSPGKGVADEEDGNDAIQVVVTGEQDEGYAVDDATTATLTDTPLRDIPQSIQVVPQQVLEDRQIIRASEALQNVSGVQRGNTVGGTSEIFNIRGFQQFGGTLRDGFKFRDNFSIPDTANLQRIEVLKGPASVLYGNLDPGGVINYITKQPLSEPFYEVAMQAGNFGLVRPTIDLSGPLNSQRTALYRLNAAYEGGGNFRDFDTEVARFFISPVVTWQISDQTDLRFEWDYLYDRRPFDRGIVAFGTGIADIPFDRVLGELDDFDARTNFSAGYRLEHRFSDNWKLRNRFRFSYLDQAAEQTELVRLDETTGNLSRQFSRNEQQIRNYELQTDLIGKFATGPIQHTLLFGVDLSWQSAPFIFRGGVAAPTINIFNPVYGTVARPSINDFPDVFSSEGQTNTLGIFLQDQVTLTDNLKLLMGGRFDTIDQSSSSNGESDERYDQAFSPRLGIVYQPIEPVSLYASFSRSFQPNFGTRFDGSLLEPVFGTQYEVGVRGEFLDGRLIANLAAYEITVSNLAVTDPENPNFSIPSGEQRSKGVEFDIAGEILPGWNIIASYAYTDARVTKDDNLEPGNLLEGVPFNSASLWSTYEIQAGDLQGLGFGLGLFYVGERQGDLNNSFQIPSYLRTDISVFYRRNNWRAAINVNNLFNIDYIEATQRRTRVDPAAPLTVRGTISVEF
jgi:iron complex outermembrane receptor protein